MADVTERVETIGVLIGDLIADVSVRIWEARNAKRRSSACMALAGPVTIRAFGGNIGSKWHHRYCPRYVRAWRQYLFF